MWVILPDCNSGIFTACLILNWKCLKLPLWQESTCRYWGNQMHYLDGKAVTDITLLCYIWIGAENVLFHLDYAASMQSIFPISLWKQQLRLAISLSSFLHFGPLSPPCTSKYLTLKSFFFCHHETSILTLIKHKAKMLLKRQRRIIIVMLLTNTVPERYRWASMLSLEAYH